MQTFLQHNLYADFLRKKKLGFGIDKRAHESGNNFIYSILIHENASIKVHSHEKNVEIIALYHKYILACCGLFPTV
jgi:hypothetical protein